MVMKGNSSDQHKSAVHRNGSPLSWQFVDVVVATAQIKMTKT